MAENENKNKIGALPYVFAGFSFIPALGVFPGLGVIIYGLVTKKRGGKLAAGIGALGILCTVLLYGTVFYAPFHGAFQKNFNILAKNNLSSIVVQVEFYKSQNRKYPESIEILQKSLPKDSFVQAQLMDSSISVFGKVRPSKLQLFYYQPVDQNHYYLLGVGPDGQPFTCDDVIPEMDPKNKIGLLIKKADCPTPEKQP